MATFFDQNHESNHKNSMIGQSVIIEVDVGDKVQVCFQILLQPVLLFTSNDIVSFKCKIISSVLFLSF